MIGRRTVLAAVLTGLLALPAPASAQDDPRSVSNALIFDVVVDRVEQHYWNASGLGDEWQTRVRDLRPQAVAAPDETALYDVMTRLMDPFQDEHMNVQGPSVFEGLDSQQAPRFWAGFEIRQRGLSHQIVSVAPDGPAAAAGIRPGHWVNTLDGAPFTYSRMLATREGQSVTFGTTLPDGSTRDAVFTLAPPRPPAPARRSWRAAEGVQVLKWASFDEGVAEWVEAELASLAPGTGVVLDLRVNNGGSMNELRRILGCFVAPGTPLYVVIPRSGVAETLDALEGCGTFSGRVVVLVDGFSLSAAELLPASISELGRGVVIGGKTGGSVLLSRQTSLPDGGRVTVSRADLRTAAGTRLEGVGVTPTVEAVTTFDDLAAGRDPALDAAVAAARGD